MATDGSPGRSSRRTFLAGMLATLGAATVIRRDLVTFAGPQPSPYGPVGTPDEYGVRVPEGFTADVVGRSGDPVPGLDHQWHWAPDGGACFASPDGLGHAYVSNSEIDAGGGGVGMVVTGPSGEFTEARWILTGTSRNCAGGATPWGTWLSCEESGDDGRVFECFPFGGDARRLDAMGAFNHEAAAVDPFGRCCYLTEDRPDGRLYRFTPDRWPDLASGRLEAASVVNGTVRWVEVAADAPARSSSTTSFDGGEGIVLDHRTLFFATKGDQRIWELDLTTDRIGVFHDALVSSSPLTHMDNLAIHPQTGHLFAAEDGGDMELCVLTRDGDTPVISAVVRFEGHDGSEVTGPAFSPDGRHLYVSSQRGVDGRGLTVRVSGPWATFIRSIDDGARVASRAVRLGP